jgi:dihydroxyacetone kinase-like protein
MSIFFDESGKISESNLNQSMIDNFSKSIDKIMKRGKVKAGVKSILDIYVPVLEFLKQNSDSKIQKDEINEILSLSLSKTKDMKAQVGRAKFLENRGLGCIDPGARSTEIILREFFDSVL